MDNDDIPAIDEALNLAIDKARAAYEKGGHPRDRAKHLALKNAKAWLSIAALQDANR